MEWVLGIIGGWVCGQDPGHTWSPGGLPLSWCQRCTGLYAGACIAAWLHLWSRPRSNGRFLEAHGLMLALMVPFGFHWVSQGPVLRAVSGVLFGAAVVTFLWLPVSGFWTRASLGAPSGFKLAIYVAGLALVAMAVPLLGECGGRWGNVMLSVLAVGGISALALLVCANLFLLSGWLRRTWAALPGGSTASDHARMARGQTGEQ